MLAGIPHRSSLEGEADKQQGQELPSARTQACGLRLPRMPARRIANGTEIHRG